MMGKRTAIAAAFLFPVLLVSAPDAEAAYTYQASVVINSITGSGGTIANTPGTGATFTSTRGTVVTFGNINNPGLYMVGMPLSANLGNLSVTTTSAASDTFNVNYSIFVTLTNPAPGGQRLTGFVSGTLTLTGVQSQGGASGGTVANQYTNPTTVGPLQFSDGTTFTVVVPTTPNAMFSSPTINGPNGNLGGTINSAVVPEPSSVLMLGLGVAALGGWSARRRMAA